MKIEITKENLSKTVGLSSRAVGQRPTTPILNNLLIKTKDGGIKTTGTNLDTTISSWVPAKIVTAGETTVPARLLNELLSVIKDEKVSLEQDKEILVLRTIKTQAKIPTISAAEFPKLTEKKAGGGKELKKAVLTQTAKEVGIAASQDEGRPVLTGVLFRPEKEKAIVVATDGYRLAKKEINKVLDEEFIIPARGLSELVKLTGESESDSVRIEVSLTDSQARFTTGHIEYYTKLIAGDFPQFDQIIPKEFSTSVVLDKDSILDSLKIVSTFARDVGSVVQLSFKDDESLISTSAPQVGESQVRINPRLKGQNLKIAFNSRYLSEGINAVKGKTVEIKFSGSAGPALIKSVEDDSFIYIVMPVRNQT
ncbi:DNA polymerase III subunit beta [Patescibacteria group bacterium]|nr:DNA polymerase III subunit beta [Patescibacteria group bacterium]